MSELNTRVRFRVRSSNLQSVPVDDTLSISGQAADAAAVGAALATKADISQVTGISVNGQQADNQGVILISGEDVPVSTTDTTKLNAAVAALQARNATNIPMSAETGAPTIAQAVNGSVNRNADAIPMSSVDPTTVKEAIEDVAGDVGDLETAVGAIQDWTAASIPYAAGTEDSVKDKIDDLNTGRVKKVNNTSPDANGNIAIDTVPLADDLSSSDNVQVDSAFIVRTAGGRASIKSSHAWVQRLKGNCVHTGYVAPVWEFTVVNATRSDPDDEITADIVKATFISEAGAEGTYTFVYTTGWTLGGESVTIGDYGITVDGTAIAGDSIVVKYGEEVRGTITPADPDMMISTGWNLFNPETGYARVAAYDGKYKVGGTYSTIRFTTTPGETTSPIVVDGNGLFTVEQDGYVILTGTDTTSTYIICCWTDWTGGYSGDFEPYDESVIDLSTVMASMTYGLCSVGTVFDEINFNTKRIIPRVKRISYTDEARAEAAASGKAYDFDEEFIYIEMTAEETAEATSSFDLDNQYEANEHGIEFFTGTNAPVGSEIAYGASLKDKLRRDVLTISQQTLNADQKAQVQENIGVKDTIAGITSVLNKAFKFTSHTYKYSCAASSNVNITATNLGITEQAGYKLAAIVKAYTGYKTLVFYQIQAALGSSNVLSIKNTTSSAANDKTAQVICMWVRNDLV